MAIDRRLQFEILKAANEAHPDGIGMNQLMNCLNIVHPDIYWSNVTAERITYDQCEKKILSSILYLEDKRLISIEEYNTHFMNVKITYYGQDFIENDGGVPAILEIQTVSFDVKKIRDVICAGLSVPQIPHEKKADIDKAIQGAPATILKTAITTIVSQGLKDPVDTARKVSGIFGVQW